LDLNSGEIVLIKEVDIIPNEESFSEFEKSQLLERIVQYDISMVLYEKEKKWSEGRAMLVSLAERFQDNQLLPIFSNIWGNSKPEPQTEFLDIPSADLTNCFNIDLEQLVDIPALDKAEYLGFEVDTETVNQFETLTNQ
jgi:hypothetical protein